MKTAVFLVLLGLSATYAGTKKTTKRGVFGESRSIGAGSLFSSHPHGHSNVIGAALNPSTGQGTATGGYSLGAGGYSGVVLGAAAGAVLGTTQIDLGSLVQEHVHVINRVGVPVAQPYPVPVEKLVPVNVPRPVDVPVERPYPVHVPVKYPVKVIKNVPVPVDKPVPVAVSVPVRVPVEVPYKVYHPHPVAVPVEQKIPIPVPDPIIVKRPVPVVIHAHLKPIHVDHFEHHH